MLGLRKHPPAIDSESLVIDTTDVHPLRYIHAIGVMPEDSYGFVPLELQDRPNAWVMAYRNTPQTAQGRASRGSNPPPAPSLVIHRLYPLIKTWKETEHQPLNHYFSLYRDTVGLRPEDTYGVLPIGTTWNMDQSEIWAEWHVVYRARPEYAAGREAYVERIKQTGLWPAPQIVAGDARAPGPIAPLDEAKVSTEYLNLPWRLPFTVAAKQLPEHMERIVLRANQAPERCYALCPTNVHRALRLAHLA